MLTESVLFVFIFQFNAHNEANNTLLLRCEISRNGDLKMQVVIASSKNLLKVNVA